MPLPLVVIDFVHVLKVLNMPFLLQEAKAAKGFFSVKVYSRIAQQSSGPILKPNI
jgi:hypothetical protein